MRKLFGIQATVRIKKDRKVYAQKMIYLWTDRVVLVLSLMQKEKYDAQI